MDESMFQVNLLHPHDDRCYGQVAGYLTAGQLITPNKLDTYGRPSLIW